MVGSEKRAAARAEAACSGEVAYQADGPAPGTPVVGVAYESSEWSDFKLAQELAARGLAVRMIDMERSDAVEAALAVVCQ